MTMAGGMPGRVGRHRFHSCGEHEAIHLGVNIRDASTGLESCAYEARSAFEGRPVRARTRKLLEAKTMGWAPVITSLSFFCVSFFAGKWKGKSAARGMGHGQEGHHSAQSAIQAPTPVQDRNPARCRRSPLQAPRGWGWNPHNRHLSG